MSTLSDTPCPNISRQPALAVESPDNLTLCLNCTRSLQGKTGTHNSNTCTLAPTLDHLLSAHTT